MLPSALRIVLLYLYQTSQSYLELSFTTKEVIEPQAPSLVYCQRHIERQRLAPLAMSHTLQAAQEVLIILNDFYSNTPHILKALCNPLTFEQKFNYLDFCYFLEKEQIITQGDIDQEMRAWTEQQQLKNAVPVADFYSLSLGVSQQLFIEASKKDRPFKI